MLETQLEPFRQECFTSDITFCYDFKSSAKSDEKTKKQKKCDVCMGTAMI